MYIYIYIYIMYTHTCGHVYAYARACSCTCVHARPHPPTHICRHVDPSVRLPSVHPSIHPSIHPYMHTVINYITYISLIHIMLHVVELRYITLVHTSACIHTYIHTYIHAYIHTYIHTYICVFMYEDIEHRHFCKTLSRSPQILRQRLQGPPRHSALRSKNPAETAVVARQEVETLSLVQPPPEENLRICCK